MIRALIQGSAAEHPLGVGGVTLVGVNRETLTKLLATLALIIVGGLSATPNAMGCAAKVGTAAVPTKVSGGPAPYRTCTIAIPRKAAGKKLVVTVLVTYKGQGRTSKLTYVIR